MSVSVAQATILLENILFETPAQAAANATGYAALSALNSAYSTVSGLASAIATSPEASIADQVVRYYTAALGRSPSGSEVAYYVAIAESGLTPAQITQGAVPLSTLNIIAGDFANSPEFQANFAATGNNVVGLLYLNILGRNPSATELAYYQNQLASGFTTTNLIQEFANSPEYIAKVNASIVTNLTAYGVTVTNLPAGGTAPATIGAIVSPITLTSFPLTSGVDTATANIFNAVLSATAANNTLNSFDTLTGGAGSTNILNITSDGTAIPAGVNVSNIQTISISTTGDQTANVSSFSGVTALNITQVSGATGATTTVTAGTGTAVTDTSVNLASVGGGTGYALTFSGGASVTATASGSDNGVATLIGSVSDTGTTGAVSLTVTDTLTAAANSAAGNITVTGGTNVTITSSVSDKVAQAAATGTVTAGDASTITSTGATGTVTINSATVDAAITAITIVGDSVAVTGGTIVTVNNTASATTAATTVATAASVTDGAVTVLDGGTATSVTINDARVTAKAYTPAVPASGGVTTAGGPGYSSSTTTVVAGSAAVPAIIGVTAGVDIVAGAAVGHVTADSSATITSVTLANYAAGSYINSAVLKSVTLSGKGAGLQIDNVGTTPLTSLSLNLNGFTESAGITINGNAITTLNVTTGGTASSTLAAITDNALTTLNIAGTQSLTLTADTASLTTIAVSGAAGFNDGGASAGSGLSGLAAAVALTTTSTGVIKAVLNDTTETFTGSSGQDIITISAEATKAITGGSASTNELILANTAATFNATAAHLTTKNVTGFTTLGVNYTAGAFGTADLSVLTGFNKIDVIAATTATFTNAAAGTALSIDSATTGVTYQVANATGSADSVVVSLNSAAGVGFTTAALTLQDGNTAGIGTVSVVTNDATTGTVQTITTLTDAGLTTLNVSGNDGLTIGGLSETVSSLAIANTSAGKVTITTLTDANLGGVTVSGTGAVTIASITGETGHFLSLTNSGTGKFTVTSLAADANLTSLTLSGSVTLNADNAGVSVPTASAAQGGVAGLTVSGSTDNAHVNINAVGAGAAATDTITLGNGNNEVTDGSTAGTVNVTVGTGSNYINVSTGTASTYSANITLGAHTASTGIDEVLTGVVAASATAPNTVITGAVTGDKLLIADGTSFTALTTAQQTTVTGEATLALAVAYVDGAAVGLAGHAATSFSYGGNSYILETVADGAVDAGVMAAGNSLIELVGTHTLSTTVTAHVYTLA